MRILQKVNGLRECTTLGLPTVKYKIFGPHHQYYEIIECVEKFFAIDGYVSIRTDTDMMRSGSTPFLFMCDDMDKIKKWVLDNSSWWLIISESILPKDVQIQCHVELIEKFGRYRLTGECNDKDVASCRQAVALGTKETGLRPIELAPEYDHVWRTLYAMLKCRRIYDRIAEVTVTKANRIVFWEI